jgi:hypothetical protein
MGGGTFYNENARHHKSFFLASGAARRAPKLLGLPERDRVGVRFVKCIKKLL